MPTIKLPQVGKLAQPATIRRWRKKVGETIEKGDILLDIEIEEGSAEIESPAAGTLKEIFVTEGKTVPVNSPLANITDGKSPATPPPPQSAPTSGGSVIPVLMPQAGQSMEEGTLIKWRVAVGDQIKKGDVIFEVETDKATMEVEATDTGRLSHILLAEGETSKVLIPVGFLADNDADVDAFLASTGSIPTAAPRSIAAAAAPTIKSVSAPTITAAGRTKASPAARKVAQERGIDLANVPTGSGPNGRILSTDVPTRTAPAATTTEGGSRKKMSQMRKAIARNLLASKQTIPHFYMKLTINAEPMYAFYQAEKTKYQCSLNDVVVLALSRALQEFPGLRSRLDNDELITFPTSNIGIAVGMDDGLVVPVLMAAERLSLAQIAVEIRRIAASAKAGKIEGMGNGVLTITNLGMFGVEEFSAIINPPEAAILAVGAAREEVIVTNGAMRIGRVMTMTLSADHRIVDGMLAAKFFARLKEILEQPTKIT
jgi:pyruvate dehydrogenase E2 component (dihydrolipoamide acetyltransferase)